MQNICQILLHRGFALVGPITGFSFRFSERKEIYEKRSSLDKNKLRHELSFGKTFNIRWSTNSIKKLYVARWWTSPNIWSGNHFQKSFVVTWQALWFRLSKHFNSKTTYGISQSWSRNKMIWKLLVANANSS